MQLTCLMLSLLLAASFNFGEEPRAKRSNTTQQAQKQQKVRTRNLAILIFDGVQIIDYTGPYETFGHVYTDDSTPAFNIYTVSEKTDPITTAMGMSVNPKYSLANAPAPDVLLIPGGDVQGQLGNAGVINWIRMKAANADVVLTVCNGAFILAKTGLLDGLEATTTATLIPMLRQEAPKVKVVDDRRFVDNGKLITAAGLSSGIDGALHVIERFYGKGTAQMAALAMEYNWDPDSKFVRAALADKYMRFNYDLKVVEGRWMSISRQGNEDQWENRWFVAGDSAAALLESINNTIGSGKTYGGAPAVKWIRIQESPAKQTIQSRWRFNDEKGATWNGVVRVEPVAGETNRFTLSVKIARRSESAQTPIR